MYTFNPVTVEEEDYRAWEMYVVLSVFFPMSS